MLYESTRGLSAKVSSAVAIKTGMAPDGGLFVPERTAPVPPERLGSMAGHSYRDRAAVILQEYLSDYAAEEIKECVESAYNGERFDSPEIAPVHKLDASLFILELWHGPTCAFKDLALQILPRLLTRAAAKTGEDSTVVILTATSGDTGKAALEGFKNVRGTEIIVFYPEDGVSEIQKLQMVTQEGDNVAVAAVKGNFDDVQAGVKEIFADEEFSRELLKLNCKLSSANSINWGRLAPQIVYYFSAYLDLSARGEIKPGEKVNFVVPTGNFGNILAAFYAYEMGLPVNRLICAANSNNVLADFIRTGIYNRGRQFKKTISPSMDILVSSNLERLLYHLCSRNGAKIREWMAGLNNTGMYRVDEQTYGLINTLFWSDFADDGETLETIRTFFRRSGYVADTHTAVGLNVYEKYALATGDPTKTVVASTASPFKFNESVAKAILGENTVKGKTELELLKVLSAASGMEIPPALRDLDQKPVLHRKVTDKNSMKDAVRSFLTGKFK
ncbi:MAG TPA: threonine synthase [Bacillota bacterium]|nr:threonine synthase [Bacillota bacterium]